MKYKILFTSNFIYEIIKTVLSDKNIPYKELTDLIIQTDDIKHIKIALEYNVCVILSDNFNNNVTVIDDKIEKATSLTSSLINAKKFIIRERFRAITKDTVENFTIIDKNEFVDMFNKFLEIDDIVRITTSTYKLFYFALNDKIVYGHFDDNDVPLGDEGEFTYEK